MLAGWKMGFAQHGSSSAYVEKKSVATGSEAGQLGRAAERWVLHGATSP